jgi:hypothetical protein
MKNKKNKKVTIFNFEKAKYNELENRINRINWYQVMEDKGVEEGWKLLIRVLQNFRDNNIPRVMRNTNYNCPWFTPQLKRLIKIRNNLHKRYKKTGLFHYRFRYKKLRNQITKKLMNPKLSMKEKL